MAMISWAVTLLLTKLARLVKAAEAAEEEGPAAEEEAEAVAAMAAVVAEADDQAVEVVAVAAVAEAEAGTVTAGIAVVAVIDAGKSLQDMKLRYKPGSLKAPRFLFLAAFPIAFNLGIAYAFPRSYLWPHYT
jgi:hypothetical protein